MSKPPTRVLCVDDHAFLVAGLRARLEVEPDMEYVGRLATADNLVPEVKRTGADIVLLDVEMPGSDVFEAMDDLRRRYPRVKTILLSAHVRDRYIDAAFKVGAWGYLTKNDSVEAVIDGIRRVTQGEVAFSPEVLERTHIVDGKRAARTAPRDSRLALLTERERQILRMIAKGMGRTAIADQICRSPMTVDNHRKAIMKKLGIHDRVELARYAIAEGLVEV